MNDISESHSVRLPEDKILSITQSSSEKIILQMAQKVIKIILTHLNIFEEKKNRRAPPRSTPEYTKPPEIVPYDDGWSGYEEPVFDF